MRSHVGTTASLVLALSFTVHAARTPAQVKQAFADLLPAGKVARVAYVAVIPFTGGPTGMIHVVQSDSGVIRPISTTRRINAWEPHFTADGKRILYWDWEQGSTCIINWDGTGWRRLRGEGEFNVFMDYYRDPVTGADMAVHQGQIAGAWAYNVDNTSQTKVLWQDGFGDDGIGVSSDGRYIAGYGTMGNPGIAQVPNGPSKACPGNWAGGCISNISPDTTRRLMHQKSAHRIEILCTWEMACQEVEILNPNSGILQTQTQTVGCVGQDPQFEYTRWHEPDYLTFWVDNLRGQPYIFCLSTKKWMCIDDTLGCAGQNSPMALIIRDSFPQGGTSIARAGAEVRAPLSRATVQGESYALDGRRLGRTVSARGIVIRRSQGTGFYKPVLQPQ